MRSSRLSFDALWERPAQVWSWGRRRCEALRRLARCAPALLQRRSALDITLVTAADDSHFFSLLQFLSSAKRHEAGTSIIVYDLGLSPRHRARLQRTFGDVPVRDFEYSRYPAHLNIRVQAGQYAWKPALIAEVLQSTETAVVWMDSGDVIVRPLASVRKLLLAHGFYSPLSTGTVARWTHPGMLEYLKVPRWILGKQNLNGACVAFNPAFPEAKQLAQRWRDLALIRECIAPAGSDRSNHRQDQSLLTILAYQMGLAQRTISARLGFRVHCDVDQHAAKESSEEDDPTVDWIAG